MSTESNTPENSPPAAQSPEEAQTAPVSQHAPQTFDPRRRLRELLSVPERDRTDAQWDEINELEIQLAPGNRVAPGQSGAPQERGPAGGRPFQQKKHPPKGGGGKRRPRPNNPNNPNSQPK